MMKKLLAQNKSWARSKQPGGFFAELAERQKPPVFWVGCCDSRVVPSEIFGLSLGDMFIHTNIANQVNPDDANTLSALACAVQVLKVQDLVVCGHTHCIGVADAVADSGDMPAATADWLQPLRELYLLHQHELPKNTAANRPRLERLVSELNVRRQVENAARLVGDLCKGGPAPTVHGWLFDLETGIVEEICSQGG